jgi:DNA adenine methylase
MRSFLKWAGNKYSILPTLKESLPLAERLVEPFVGSGAVFLNTDYPAYLLADTNADLITLYQQLQQRGEAFIEECQALFTPEMNQREVYFSLRDEFNQCRDSARRSAVFVYLNRHGYNGLCRYNSKGGFNVPFGQYRKPYFPRDEMLFFHQKAQKAEFRHQDFRETFEQVKTGDAVYGDPPYVPLSLTASFTTYAAGGFTQGDQQALADWAVRVAREKKVQVLLSNHDTGWVRQTYKTGHMVSFEVQRFISCVGSGRKKAPELLAIFS